MHYLLSLAQLLILTATSLQFPFRQMSSMRGAKRLRESAQDGGHVQSVEIIDMNRTMWRVVSGAMWNEDFDEHSNLSDITHD